MQGSCYEAFFYLMFNFDNSLIWYNIKFIRTSPTRSCFTLTNFYLERLPFQLGAPLFQLGILPFLLGIKLLCLGPPLIHLGITLIYLGLPLFHLGESLIHLGRPLFHLGWASSQHLRTLSKNLPQLIKIKYFLIENLYKLSKNLLSLIKFCAALTEDGLSQGALFNILSKNFMFLSKWMARRTGSFKSLMQNRVSI